MTDFDVVRHKLVSGGDTLDDISGSEALARIEAEHRLMSEQLTLLAWEGHYPTEGTSP